MLLAARHATEFSGDLPWEQLDVDPLHQHAIAKALKSITEAAGKVSDDFRAADPEIPWRGIIGLRHRIVHEHFSLDLVRVRSIVSTGAPALIRLLEPVVPPERSECTRRLGAHECALGMADTGSGPWVPRARKDEETNCLITVPDVGYINCFGRNLHPPRKDRFRPIHPS